MKQPLFLSAAVALLVAVHRTPAQQERPHSYVPPNGFVPDSLTAVRIAVAVWTPIYKSSVIDGEQPYVATLHAGVWRVRGSMPAGSGPGGVAVAETSKRDGKILRISHGK